jgi:hypothetical protein
MEPLGFKGWNTIKETGLEGKVEKTKLYVNDSTTNAGLNFNMKAAMDTFKTWQS